MTNHLKEKISKLSYKYLLAFGTSILVFIIAIIFFVYIYHNIMVESREESGRSTEFLSDRMTTLIDDKLSMFEKYYIASVDESEMQWILSNDFSYSDYSRYKSVMDIMSSRKMFTDYIENYALVIYKTEWVISNKGVMKLDEISNRAVLQEIFRQGRSSGLHHYWMFEKEEEDNLAVSTADPNYRSVVDTKGLVLVLRLPLNSVNTNALALINVNTKTLEDWATSMLDVGDSVVITDQNGTIVFSTDDRYNAVTLKKAAEKNDGFFRVSEKGVPDSVGAESVSAVTGWHYYVYSELSRNAFSNGGHTWTWIWMVLILLIIAGLITFLGYSIYSPLNGLVRKVTNEDGMIRGNEFNLISEHITNLAGDKEMLEKKLNSQMSRVQDTFEKRLINEGIKSEEEWSDYFEGLHIPVHKCYAVGVMVLDIGNTDQSQSTINEDAICLDLIDAMPDDIKKYFWMPAIFNSSAIVTFFGDEDEDDLLKNILEFNEKMQEFAFAHTGYHVLSGISSTCHDYRHFRRAYRESVKALTKQGYEEFTGEPPYGTENSTNDCRFYIASKPSIKGESYSNSFENDIFVAIKEVDKHKAYQITDRFAEHLVTITSSDISTLHIMRYVNSIVLTALEAGAAPEEIFPEGLAKAYDVLFETIEPRKVRKNIKMMFIDPIIDKLTDKMQNDSYVIMESIDRLMEQTKGNILLAECADELNVHQTYIWKILKMQKGKSFTEYAEKYKIEEAKKLLLQTEMSVQEIAASLDYANAQNFIRFFSRVTGVTPGKFRKLY